MSTIADDIYDETSEEISYCPRCGEELEGEYPVRCPTHGPVNIDYWESGFEDE